MKIERHTVIYYQRPMKIWNSFPKAHPVFCCKARKCHWNLEKAIALSGKTYPYNRIEVKCVEGFIPQDRSQKMSVICEFEESTKSFEWNRKNYSKCIENNCIAHTDFKWLAENIRKDSYSIGEQVSYTCPGGYRMRTICDIDLFTGFGEWDFTGSCSGIIFL